MEYTNKVLDKMSVQKTLYNRQFASWYYGLYKENGGEIHRLSITDEKGRKKIKLQPAEDTNAKYFNRGDRIGSCLNLWVWDKYEKNKLLDLQRVNRCMNRVFCPNCKTLSVARFIHEFRQQMGQLQDYDFYMLTLTVPSVHADDTGDNLNEVLVKLSNRLQKLNRKYSAPLLTPTGKESSQALQCRYFDIAGGVRVLEITYNDEQGFHPHYHLVVLVPKKNIISEDLLKKHIPAKWSTKRNSLDYKSDVEVQIGKAWSMIWQNIDFRKWDKVEFNPAKTHLIIDNQKSDYRVLEVEFSPLDEDGIYEVFKYCFKNEDIANYRVFKNLVYALDSKRIRQGFGVLHNLKCEDEEKGEAQPLELEFEEEPEALVTREIAALVTEYGEYKKISRFNKSTTEEVESVFSANIS